MLVYVAQVETTIFSKLISFLPFRYGMGHLVSPTTVQEITEGVEEFVTGL